MELHHTPKSKVGKNKSYFINDPLDGDNKYTANDICKMTEFLVDNIYVGFGGHLPDGRLALHGNKLHPTIS